MSGKYKNKTITIDGEVFDSLAEGRRYIALKLLRRAGRITDLKVHPRYLLQPAFKNWAGKRIAAMYYEADFEYIENGCTVVEDVKGVETEAFKLKWKMLQFYYRHLVCRIIPAKDVPG